MMEQLKQLLDNIGISKVRLAKYLGVSRQMLYNYLALKNIDELPKEKATRLFGLLGINSDKDIDTIKVDGNYIIEVESRLNEGVRDTSEREILTDLKDADRFELDDIREIAMDLLYDDSTKNLTIEKIRNSKKKEYDI